MLSPCHPNIFCPGRPTVPHPKAAPLTPGTCELGDLILASGSCWVWSLCSIGREGTIQHGALLAEGTLGIGS